MYVSILLDFMGLIAYSVRHENTINTIRIAASGVVSCDFDYRDGGLLLARTAISATRLRMPYDHTDGVAAGCDRAGQDVDALLAVQGVVAAGEYLGAVEGVDEFDEAERSAHLVFVDDGGAGADAAAEHCLFEHADARFGAPGPLFQGLHALFETAQAQSHGHIVSRDLGGCAGRVAACAGNRFTFARWIGGAGRRRIGIAG